MTLTTSVRQEPNASPNEAPYSQRPYLKRCPPWLLGGLLIGVLSTISERTLLIALWAALGAFLTVYLQHRSRVEALDKGDAMLQGLFAGLLGAAVASLVTFTAPWSTFQEDVGNVIRQARDLPPAIIGRAATRVRDIRFLMVVAVIQMNVYALGGMFAALFWCVLFRIVDSDRSHDTVVDNIQRRQPMSLAKVLFSFEDRIGRSEYWLKGLLILLSINILTHMTGSVEFSMIVGIGLLWPALALLVKRLRDRGRSPWWLLTCLLPILAFAVWIQVEVLFLRGRLGVIAVR